MTEYITKEQALSAMHKATNCTWDDIWNTEYVLKSVPAADVAPIEYASWIEDDYGYARCDFCGYEIAYPEYKTPRCPGCGERMEGDQDD